MFIPRGLREPASEIVTLEMMKRTRALLIVRCTEEGLLSGQCMAIDAGLIEADANIQNSMPKEDWYVSDIDPARAPRALCEYLDMLD